MGWTWYHCNERKADRSPDAKAEIDSMLCRDGYTVLKSAMVGSTYYAAVSSPGSDDVWAAVFLTQVDRSQYYDFGYKDMDETMGPYQADCPQSILSLLTPTDSEWANAWRDRCAKSNAERTWFTNLDDGACVTWTVPSDGFGVFGKGDLVTLVKGPLKPWKKRSKRVWHVQGRPYYLNRAEVKLEDVDILSVIG